MRVILADQDQKALWALVLLVNEEPGIFIVGQAEDLQGLQQLIENVPADLILLDRKLAHQNIESLIREMKVLKPRPIIVVMSSNAEDSRLMFKVGADAFVSKGDDPDWLLNTLRKYAKRNKPKGLLS